MFQYGAASSVLAGVSADTSAACCAKLEEEVKSIDVAFDSCVDGKRSEVLSAEPEPMPEPPVDVPQRTRPRLGVLWQTVGYTLTFVTIVFFVHWLLSDGTLPLARSSRSIETVALDVTSPSPKRPMYTLPLYRQLIPMVTIGNSVHYKSAYWGTLSVGTPAVPFKVVFDTGSGHLILPSTYCHSATCRGHRRYRRSATSSGIDIDGDGRAVSPTEPRDEINVAFGTGEVQGVFVDEIVCLGHEHAARAEQAARGAGLPLPGTAQAAAAGLPEPPAVLNDNCMRLRMIIATDMTEEPFRTFTFDGVLGLGLESLSQAKEFNFMHGIANSIVPGAEVFAVYLSEGETAPSEITLGGWRPERLASSLAWNKVIRPELGHWMLSIKSLRVDDTPINFCKEGCKAVVDTGTSLLAVPPVVFPEVFDLLKYNPEENHCKGDGPRIHFELDNITITLGPRDYGSRLDEPTNDASKKNETGGMFMAASTQICKPMLMSMELPEPLGPRLFILGEPALRKYYTVYNARNKQIGFGLAAVP